MDALLPGVAGWELAYNNDNLWHFRFHGPTPEARSSKVARRSISPTSGTTWLLTKSARFPPLTVTQMSRHIRVQAACARAGPTLQPGPTRQRISLKWPKRS
jgi:hypothetical protein